MPKHSFISLATNWVAGATWLTNKHENTFHIADWTFCISKCSAKITVMKLIYITLGYCLQKRQMPSSPGQNGWLCYQGWCVPWMDCLQCPRHHTWRGRRTLQAPLANTWRHTSHHSGPHTRSSPGKGPQWQTLQQADAQWQLGKWNSHLVNIENRWKRPRNSRVFTSCGGWLWQISSQS